MHTCYQEQRRQTGKGVRGEKRNKASLPVDGLCDELEAQEADEVGVTGLILMPFKVLTESVGGTESTVLDDDGFALSKW